MNDASHDLPLPDRGPAGESATPGQIGALIVVGTALAITSAGLGFSALHLGPLLPGGPPPVPVQETLRFMNPPRSGFDCPAAVDIEFVSGSRRLVAPEADSAPTRFADWARRHPQVAIEVTGYADAPSDPDANVILSYARARAVADWLAARDVAASRLLVRAAAEPGSEAAVPGKPGFERRAQVRVADSADCDSPGAR